VEIFLNLAWVALAIALILSWLRLGNRGQVGCRHQVVALAVLIAILLPVISVSDDLMAVQNATETDSCQRRDSHAHPGAHPAFHPDCGVPVAVFTGWGLRRPKVFTHPRIPLLAVNQPALPATQNRPPPTA
jgi:hypothetical protein